jgi:hypothetical protein
MTSNSLALAAILSLNPPLIKSLEQVPTEKRFSLFDVMLYDESGIRMDWEYHAGDG